MISRDAFEEWESSMLPDGSAAWMDAALAADLDTFEGFDEILDDHKTEQLYKYGYAEDTAAFRCDRHSELVVAEEHGPPAFKTKAQLEVDPAAGKGIFVSTLCYISVEDRIDYLSSKVSPSAADQYSANPQRSNQSLSKWKAGMLDLDGGATNIEAQIGVGVAVFAGYGNVGMEHRMKFLISIYVYLWIRFEKKMEEKKDVLRASNEYHLELTEITSIPNMLNKIRWKPTEKQHS